MKYFQFLTLPPIAEPARIPKTKYDSFVVEMTDNIFTSAARGLLASAPIQSGGKLLTFEELDQFSGFVLYEASLPKSTRDPNNLVINMLRDRAQVYIDGKSAGVLSRENNIYSLPISASFGKRVQILVENQGRINFQENFDLKGILGNVTIQTFNEPFFEELSDWTITGYPFDDYAKIESFIETGFKEQTLKNGWLRDGPALFSGELNIPEEAVIANTWWDASGWGKGVLFVNGFNLGRYWPLVGPQVTMFIPGALLKRGVNTFVILEQQKVPNDRLINFTNEPNFSED